MNDYEVFYRKALGPPTVWHVNIQATSKEEALEAAKKQLPASVTVFRADELPKWEVTPN